MGRIAIASAVSIIAFACCAAPQTMGQRLGDPEVAVARRSLTGDQIKNEIVGNSITGVENGVAYFEYLAPDGNISGKDDSGPYHGLWRIERDQICFIYDAEEDAEPKSNGWDCNPVTRDGAKLYWSDDVDDGTPSEATLVKDNPRNLGQ